MRGVHTGSSGSSGVPVSDATVHVRTGYEGEQAVEEGENFTNAEIGGQLTSSALLRLIFSSFSDASSFRSVFSRSCAFVSSFLSLL